MIQKQLLSRVGNAKDEINKEQEEMIRSLLSRLAPLLIDHTSLLVCSFYEYTIPFFSFVHSGINSIHA